MILIGIISVVLILIWYLESRIFLILYHKLIFLFVNNPAVIENHHEHLPDLALEKHWKTIRNEVEEVLSQKVSIPRFHEVDAANHKISFNEGPAWSTIILKAFGGWHTQNCAMLKETTALLYNHPQISSALISILEPGCKIPPHTGKFKGILRYHLGLKIPKEDSCFMVLDNQKLFWKEGSSVLFDDTFMHEVSNNSTEQRIVLFLNIKRKMPLIAELLNNLIMRLIIWSPVYKKGLKNGQII